MAILPLVNAFVGQGLDGFVKVREKCANGFHEVAKTMEPAGFARMLRQVGAKHKSKETEGL
jgi:hypothetical protein